MDRKSRLTKKSQLACLYKHLFCFYPTVYVKLNKYFSSSFDVLGVFVLDGLYASFVSMRLNIVEFDFLPVSKYAASATYMSLSSFAKIT